MHLRSFLVLCAVAAVQAFVPVTPHRAARAPLTARRSPPLPARRGGLVSLRGGAGAAAVELAQHADRAAALFGNMRVPASIILGSIVPLTFAFELPKCGSEEANRRWHAVNLLLGTFSLLSELVAVMHSSIAVNKLTETAPALAPSVLALLRRDFELAWLGTNVHFFFGLLGIAAMVGLRAGLALGVLPAAATSSAVLLMMSVLNDGIRTGDGLEGGIRFGGHIGSLTVRYCELLLRSAGVTYRPLLLGALALPVGALVVAARRSGGPAPPNAAPC